MNNLSSRAPKVCAGDEKVYMDSGCGHERVNTSTIIHRDKYMNPKSTKMMCYCKGYQRYVRNCKCDYLY